MIYISFFKMKQFAFIIVVVLAIIPQGYGLKCNVCGPPNSCQTPAELTCSAPNDQCFTLRAKVEMTGVGAMTMEMRNCAVGSVMCTEAYKQQMCKQMEAAGTLKSCNYSCCQGDLCNSGNNAQGSGLKPVKPASNKPLTCYECSSEGMGPDGTGTPLISCSAPKQRRCGEVGPGMPFDRCMTVKVTVKNPVTGALLEQEMRNCSLAFACNGNSICDNMKAGGFVKCDIQCCEGNLCNVGQALPKTTAGPSPSGSSTPEPSPDVLFQSASPSEAESEDHTLAVSAGILASVGIILAVIFMFMRFR